MYTPQPIPINRDFSRYLPLPECSLSCRSNVLDTPVCRYVSVLCFQRQGQEIGDTISQALKTCLESYSKINQVIPLPLSRLTVNSLNILLHLHAQTLPRHIIIFRDGVGEGQLAAVTGMEVPQIQRSFQFFPDYEPRVAVVIVTKRVNARFFVKNPNGFSNPPPGTVVDTGVVRSDGYDFYIVPQSVNQGSAAPTHFLVVLDTWCYRLIACKP